MICIYISLGLGSIESNTRMHDDANCPYFALTNHV